MRLFFILGRGRSGTTLLARLLTQHPRIAVAPEGMFLLNLRKRYGRDRLTASALNALCRDLLLERRMHGWHLQPDALRTRMLALGSSPSYAQACAAVYHSYAADTLQREVAWVGDKNPHHALFAGRLAALFPEARFVHVVRDPRDNVASFRRAAFDLDHEGALAFRWRYYNRAIRRGLRDARDRTLVLRYEDLVRRPERELERVCDLLGLPFDPSMLTARGPEVRLQPGASPGWFEQPITGIDSTRMQRFRAELSPKALRVVDAITAPLGSEYGYPAALPQPRSSLFLGPLGLLYGWGSVQAEKVLFGTLPVALRLRLINAYRRAPGRNP